ncbi:MAG TPA: Mov34/MPN/PAD-1 family protein [Candidatus Acidoferrum sp.]|nr:Mov34/MPN/PAD-1 family protein [Candidatus Acidoferrum sp.]
MILTPSELEAIRKQAVDEYPAESCGLVFVRGTERLVLPCRNDQDAKHKEDPQRYPRDSRTAYYIHADDLKRIAQLELQGYSMAVIYHSHIDVGAYFSPTDKKQALMSGYLDPVYVVTSVVSGQAEATKAFRWSADHNEFVETER